MPFAALADLVGMLALAVVLAELLGSVGQFRRGPFIAASLVIAGISIWRCKRPPERIRPPQAEPSKLPAATAVVVAAASCALVFAQWSTWVAHDVTLGVGNAGGPGNGDSLWYHMPIAASFVQSGWTTHLLFLNGEALVTYYPANTSILHAIGILAMRTDVLSPFVNIALLPVALLAGWCIGARRGVGAATLAAVAVACTIPVVVVSEAGTAKDDVLGLVGLLAAIAFLERGRDDRAAAIYSGLGAGLAIGSKLTFVAPILVLALGLVLVTPTDEPALDEHPLASRRVRDGELLVPEEPVRDREPDPGAQPRNRPIPPTTADAVDGRLRHGRSAQPHRRPHLARGAHSRPASRDSDRRGLSRSRSSRSRRSSGS